MPFLSIRHATIGSSRNSATLSPSQEMHTPTRFGLAFGTTLPVSGRSSPNTLCTVPSATVRLYRLTICKVLCPRTSANSAIVASLPNGRFGLDGPLFGVGETG